MARKYNRATERQRRRGNRVGAVNVHFRRIKRIARKRDKLPFRGF